MARSHGLRGGGGVQAAELGGDEGACEHAAKAWRGAAEVGQAGDTYVGLGGQGATCLHAADQLVECGHVGVPGAGDSGRTTSERVLQLFSHEGGTTATPGSLGLGLGLSLRLLRLHLEALQTPFHLLQGEHHTGAC